MSRDALIRVEGLGKRYRFVASTPATTVSDAARSALATIRERRAQGGKQERDWFWALRDVSFDVASGEVLGVVGPNGAGKSTLLKILSRITDPTEGRAEVHGRAGSLLEVGTGFHPELTGRENVFLNGAILGMRRREIASKLDEIIEFSGIARFVDMPVKRYSSGMYVRLAFAVAAHLEPEILLIDEVLAVGDIEFQRRCLGRMDEVAHSGRTIIFVSHNLASVASLCTNAIFLDHGRVAARGVVDEVLEAYVASVEKGGTTSLRDRVDRQGSGPMRFTSADVFGPAGPLVVGQLASVDLGYEADKELRNVFVSFSVYGAMGEVVFHCSNKLSADHLARAPAAGTFRCSIPRLPLMPGRYWLNLYCEVEGSPSDWVQSAHAFDVLEGDFFGSGHLPPAGHGRIMVDHGWELVEAEAPEISRAEAQL